MIIIYPFGNCKSKHEIVLPTRIFPRVGRSTSNAFQSWTRSQDALSVGFQGRLKAAPWAGKKTSQNSTETLPLHSLTLYLQSTIAGDALQNHFGMPWHANKRAGRKLVFYSQKSYDRIQGRCAQICIRNQNLRLHWLIISRETVFHAIPLRMRTRSLLSAYE